jgi:hypothetical protein
LLQRSAVKGVCCALANCAVKKTVKCPSLTDSCSKQYNFNDLQGG